jgi:hypothetical protein
MVLHVGGENGERSKEEGKKIYWEKSEKKRKKKCVVCMERGEKKEKKFE